MMRFRKAISDMTSTVKITDASLNVYICRSLIYLMHYILLIVNDWILI